MNDAEFINIFAHTENVAADELRSILEDVGKWAESHGIDQLADAMYRATYLLEQALDDQVDIHEHREMLVSVLKQAETYGYMNGASHD